MFKISYADLRSDRFRAAMGKLSSCAEYKMKVGYNIMRLAKVLEAELKKSQTEWIELASKYVQKDEKGNFKITPEGFEFIEGVDGEVAKKEIEAFGLKEVIVDRFKLKLDDIEKAKLTPADMSAVDMLLDPGLEVV